MTDPMTRLRATDPVPRSRLPRVDADVWATLGDGITATAPGPDGAREDTPRTRRRLGKRGAIAVGVAVALAGGGVAYATIAQRYSEDQVACQPADADGRVVVPQLTGDPIADCDTALRAEGAEPIANPVAYQDPRQNAVVVVPSDRVPDGVTPLDSRYRMSEPQALEVQQSIMDFVDGGNSTCRTVPEQVGWARAELDRLGLGDWSVVVHGSSAAPCSTIGADVSGVLMVIPTADPVEDVFMDGDWPLADELRAAISDRCLSVDEARAAADEAIARAYADTVPTTSVADETADCARVDATIGGDVRVTVYGPKEARE